MSKPSSPEYDENGAPVSAVDWLGNRFRVGERVIYCIGAGRGQQMAVGEVKQIKVEQRIGRRAREAEPGEDADFIADWLTPPRPMVRYEEPYEVITVQVLTERASGWSGSKRSKPAWVNPMNITALPLFLAEIESVG
ncbi:hypothetical protein FHR83_007072 [Actinoplanes campanulatus]|uniref:EVE domain-containing protein n=1 Tax=Actinoplanes campanulatus TaxID=113559 RepID=A0A7W5ANG6_9ACTN|nr:hypothetical protein [Actinoplanes campanulatus]MBB3099366.1 hypothetical protein [Actinoplanes campanulatus]GGN40270.1 hypothetical protein GCM10010109_69200 [Actinoplanes campanulatus]GID42425.1 hypothetical protein Aca09nite_89310 [Actinoplanes campanulatus]